MSISLSEKIVAIYPDLKGVRFNEGDIIVANNSDGKGDFIAKWDVTDKSKPTDQQLEAVDVSAIEAEKNLSLLRIERDLLLQQSDWTQNRDVTLTNDAAWQTYRQALRDITNTYTSLDDVVWPEKP